MLAKCILVSPIHGSWHDTAGLSKIVCAAGQTMISGMMFCLLNMNTRSLESQQTRIMVMLVVLAWQLNKAKSIQAL
jgi:hypothetical protein